MNAALSGSRLLAAYTCFCYYKTILCSFFSVSDCYYSGLDLRCWWFYIEGLRELYREVLTIDLF